MNKKKTVALVVLDGFGESSKIVGNAVKDAKMPFYNSLVKKYPSSLLRASGEFVGLKKGQMGNSETGHLNIGAGRIVRQDLTIIDDAISDNSFYQNKALAQFFKKMKQESKDIHIMGLISNGGVHSHIEHLFATLKMAKQFNLKQVFIHCFTDGRDVGTTTGLGFVKDIIKFTKTLDIGKIATVSGRFYSMDREKLYDRTNKAYEAMCYGKGNKTNDVLKTIKECYENNETDEFIKPIVVCENNKPIKLIDENSAIIFFNFRKDRAKQITDSLINKDFKGFKTQFVIKDFLTFTNLGDDLKTLVAFDKEKVQNSLCEVISKNNMIIAKFAEPTKFPHVTYFLNGGKEDPFKNEDWYKIPPKKVKTFDLAPEMSAIELAETLKKEVKENKYDFVMCNLANCDMVGHTGNFKATIKACETVDKSLKIIINHILNINGEALICADHGNAEQMIYRNKMCTTHTNNPVRLIYVSKFKNSILKKGTLKDIAPTILTLLNIKIPKCYTGKNLLLTTKI